MPKISTKLPNWSKDEDIALCKAWINISEDGATGTNQNIQEFWSRVYEVFISTSPPPLPDKPRTLDGMYDRFKRINKKCTCWKSAYNKAKDVLESGKSQEDMINKAMAIFMTLDTPKGHEFKLFHAWNILKDCPRWNENVASKVPRQPFEGGASVDVDGDFVDESPSSSIARPPGRDKQKEAKKKGKQVDSASEKYEEKLDKLLHCSEESNQEKLQMRKLMERQMEMEEREMARKATRDKLDQDVYELDIMKMDLDKFTPRRKRFFREKQDEILSRRTLFDDVGYSFHPSPPPY